MKNWKFKSNFKIGLFFSPHNRLAFLKFVFVVHQITNYTLSALSPAEKSLKCKTICPNFIDVCPYYNF